MQTARTRKAASPSRKRSFTWDIQASDVAWARPAGTPAAIDGSGGEPIAITMLDRRRRRKPVPFTPA